MDATGANAAAPARTRITLAVLIAGSLAAYLSRFAYDPLGASEAYSAWAASQPGAGAIVAIPVLHDPGKQILYYLLLHYFIAIFGHSELALRALSMLFGVGSLALIYVLGRELFDRETGVAAVAIWAFNPLAMIFAYRARGYSMLMFVGLAQLLALWRLRANPAAGRTILAGVLGALLLYTHLSGVLLLGAECAMLVRDFIGGRRAAQPWIAMGLAALLFAPYLPIALRQSHQLVAGHWLDWMGTAQYAQAARALAAFAGVVLALALIFAPAPERRDGEPLRWMTAWSVLPIAALLLGSIAVRPMFTPRYVLPSFAALAILTAAALTLWSVKLRNLTAGGLAVAFILMMPYDRPGREPWRELAAAVEVAHRPAQPIFFESGFIAHGAAGRIANPGFPFGYYSIPFDYYFHGPNPRVVVPGHDPAAARGIIEARVQAAGGGWLVSWKNADEIAGELPDTHRFQIATLAKEPQLTIYRMVPLAKPGK